MTREHNSDKNGAPGGAAIIADIRARFESTAPIEIAGLGDSLTYGWVVNKGFFERFVDKVKGAFPACPIRSFNAGIPGDTAKGGLMRVDDLLERVPQIVTIQFGLNDMYQGVDPDEFGETLAQIVQRILTANALPILVTSCPLNWAEGQQTAHAFYERIREAAKNENVPCASLDLYWQKIAGPADHWGGLVQSDNVHPTDQGHRLMADGLFERIIGGGALRRPPKNAS